MSVVKILSDLSQNGFVIAEIGESKDDLISFISELDKYGWKAFYPNGDDRFDINGIRTLCARDFEDKEKVAFSSGAWSTESLGIHTDASSYEEVPKLIGLHMENPACDGGGVNLVLDGHYLRSYLQEEGLWHDFAETVFEWTDSSGIVHCRKTFKDGRLCFHPSRKELYSPLVQEALKVFFDTKCLMEVRSVALKSGEILLLDNHRMLHDRTSFTDIDRKVNRIWFTSISAS